MNRFKFRAECFTDVERFLHKTNGTIKKVTIDFFDVPDVEVVFTTEMSMDFFLAEMKEVDDSHVMIQTLEPEESYTGERNWDRPVF